jgi:MFS family permease
MWMRSVAIGWVVYELTGSHFSLGFTTFARFIPTVFLLLPAGLVADRAPRRTVLFASKGTLIVSGLTLAVLTATGAIQAWHIALVSVFLGIALSFDSPSSDALTVEMLEDRGDVANAVALSQMIGNIARVVGPAIGGIVLATLGAAWCFGLNAAGYLGTVVALLLIRLPQRVRTPPRGSLRDQLVSGLRYVARSRLIRTIVILYSVSFLLGLSYATLLPVYAADILQIGETGLGTLNTAVGAGALAGSLVAASMSRSRRKGMLLTIGSLLFPSALLVFAVSRSVALTVVALACIGFGSTARNSAGSAIIQTIVPSEMRGRVTSIVILGRTAAVPFGSLLAGALAQALGPTTATLVTGVPCLAFAAGVALFVPALRRVEV